MSILSNNIKFYKPSKMSDRPDSGGMATANEIVGGVSNEIMPDISPLDRAEGRMFMRKIFPQVVTSDTEMYLGAHTIISKIPKDEKLAVFLFNSDDYHDIRSEASSAFAAYRTRSARHQGVLWGTQWSGSKSLLIYQQPDAPIPTNNEVYELLKAGSTVSQFVRIVNVNDEVRTFYVGANNELVTKRIVSAELAQKLEYDFIGDEMKKSSEQYNSQLYTTTVSDASNIYTSKYLTAPITSGDLTCQIDTPFIQAVPASTGFEGLLALPPYSTYPTSGNTGVTLSSKAPEYVGLHETSYQFTPFEESSFKLSGGSVVIDVVDGKLLSGTQVVGEANPLTGLVEFGDTGLSDKQLVLEYEPMAVLNRVGQSDALEITSGNISLTYTHQFNRNITKGSVVVKYKSLGEMYSLYDNGSGALVGDGSGVIDYGNNSLAINLNSLPDEGSIILLSGSTITSEMPIIDQSDRAMYFSIPTAGKTVNLATVTVTWDYLGSKSLFNGDCTISQGESDLRIYPDILPNPSTVFTITLDYTVSHTNTHAPTGGDFNLATSEWTITSESGVYIPNKFRATQTSNRNLWHFVLSGNGVPSDDVTYIDDGNGLIVLESDPALNVGTINYATGVATFIPVADVRIGTYHPDTCSWTYVNGTETINPLYVGSLHVLQIVDNTVTATQTTNTSISELHYDAHEDGLVGQIADTGVAFSLSGYGYVSNDYKLYSMLAIVGGQTTEVGYFSKTDGLITLSQWTEGKVNVLTDSFINWVGTDVQSTPNMAWYAPSTPIQAGSISGNITLTDPDQTVVTFSANSAGVITTTGEPTGITISGVENSVQGYADLNIVGQLNGVDVHFIVDSMQYNVVVQNVVPVDPDIVKMDTVRLPIDGRMTAYRAGDLIVAINDVETVAVVTVGTEQTLRDDTSYVHIKDAAGLDIPATAYTIDFTTHKVTWVDVTGVTMPITLVDRVEEMRVLTKVSNTGELTVRDPFTMDFTSGDTLICSSVVSTDMFASVSRPFDQETWLNNWLDSAEGTLALGEYNDTIYPINVTNQGCIDERWLVKFRGSTTVDIIGEHLGVLLENVNVNAVIAPINPIQQVPYFAIPAGALTGFFGGNVVRFDTYSSSSPLWVMESVSYGEATDTTDEAHKFCIEMRGAVDV